MTANAFALIVAAAIIGPVLVSSVMLYILRIVLVAWEDVRRKDRASAMEAQFLVEQRRSDTALRVAEINRLRMDVAIESDAEILIRTAVDLLRTVVAATGGIPGTASSPGEASRGIVRELRALYDEAHNPTPAPHTTTTANDAELDALDRDLFDTDNKFAEALDEDLL